VGSLLPLYTIITVTVAPTAKTLEIYDCLLQHDADVNPNAMRHMTYYPQNRKYITYCIIV